MHLSAPNSAVVLACIILRRPCNEFLELGFCFNVQLGKIMIFYSFKECFPDWCTSLPQEVFTDSHSCVAHSLLLSFTGKQSAVGTNMSFCLTLCSHAARWLRRRRNPRVLIWKISIAFFASFSPYLHHHCMFLLVLWNRFFEVPSTHVIKHTLGSRWEQLLELGGQGDSEANK